jgi:hypothetical protein
MHDARARSVATSLTLAAVCALTFACGAKAKPDPLKPFTECRFDDGLQVVSVDRLPPGEEWRSVDTRSGSKSVSLADGYRVMLAYPNTDYFVNLKVEQSQAGMFRWDTATIVESMEWLASQGNGAAVPLEHTQIGGLDAYGFTQPSLNGGGVLSLYSLFDNKLEMVITAYVLNQPPQRRKFRTMEEYRTLRDRFLARYAACVAEHGG